ncbi:Rv3235 family protein [Demequina sp. NBRC 110057]|uniref:Rv3235 family protein n=1 Tax=Demequina sp. NBRC 110057 TaxID=1570346 RepID=UPI0013562DDD|nr:Rv3235 family protein [Demequina sp. NBRC 110057]
MTATAGAVGAPNAPGLASGPHSPRASVYARHHRPLGDPAPLACTLAKAVVEAVTGGADLTTLARWIDPVVRACLARQRTLARRRAVLAAAGPASQGPDDTASAPATVLRARVCRTAAGAAEVSAVVHDGQRTRAVAMRFEDQHGRWLATVIEVL